MFHYRLAPSNNRSRMLIAAFLAVAVHIGFMNFEFVPKPIFVPSVSIPHSVSIFLSQKNVVETPVHQAKNAQTTKHLNEEHLSAEIKPETPVPSKASAIQDKPNSSFQPPVLLEERVKQPADIAEEKSKPAVEEIVPAYKKAEDITEDLMPEAGEAAKVEELVTQADPQTAQEGEGVILPGTLQMAYPRYQLNAPPTYPSLARKRGQEGTVILQVLVNREGRVDDLEINASSNFTLLDRATVTAVRKWSFEPGRRGEERVPMWVRVPVTFKLKK